MNLIPKRQYGGPQLVQNNKSLTLVMHNGPKKDKNIKDGLSVAEDAALVYFPIDYGWAAMANGIAKYNKYMRRARTLDPWGKYRATTNRGYRAFLARDAANEALADGLTQTTIGTIPSIIGFGAKYGEGPMAPSKNDTKESKKSNKK